MTPSAVSAEFRVHGLSLRSDAMREVCSYLQTRRDADAALQQLLEALQAVNRACACACRRQCAS